MRAGRLGAGALPGTGLGGSRAEEVALALRGPARAGSSSASGAVAAAARGGARCCDLRASLAAATPAAGSETVQPGWLGLGAPRAVPIGPRAMAHPGEEALPGPETVVQIRVAIQEAEDAEELEDDEEGAEARGAGHLARYLSPGWGSASEEEPSRGHR